MRTVGMTFSVLGRRYTYIRGDESKVKTRLYIGGMFGEFVFFCPMKVDSETLGGSESHVQQLREQEI